MVSIPKTKCYRKGKCWYLDEVPIHANMRFESVEYLGMCKKYLHSFKNGNKERRWELVDSIAPNDQVWFMLNITLDRVFSYHLAVTLEDTTISFQWLTAKLPISRDSDAQICPIDLSILEVAVIESTIMDALT